MFTPNTGKYSYNDIMPDLNAQRDRNVTLFYSRESFFALKENKRLFLIPISYFLGKTL